MAPSKVKEKEAPASTLQHGDDARLMDLTGKAKRSGKRPRTENDPPDLKDCIIAFKPDEVDPEQSGDVNPKESGEIKEYVKEAKKERYDPPPIAKTERVKYVWVALSKSSLDEKSVYTMDPEDMRPTDNYQEKSQNACDICGAACTEVLYTFRCYRRQPPGMQSSARKLHRFISYVSHKCGAGLLGKRSDETQLRELVYRMTLGDDPAAQFEAVYSSANAQQRRVLENELAYFAGIEVGDRRGVAMELKKFQEASTWGGGPLHRIAEEPFRALARATAPNVYARDLAAGTVLHAQDAGEIQEGSFLASVRDCLQTRQPLPSPPAPFTLEDLSETLTAIAKAWSFKIELYSTLHPRTDFEPQDRVESILKLVYLNGARSLHGPVEQKLDKSAAKQLQESNQQLIQRSKLVYDQVVAHKVAHGPSIKEDQMIRVPDQVSPQYLTEVLNNLKWPDCTSRGNVTPDGMQSIEAFCVGLIKPYFLAVTCSTWTRKLRNVTRLAARLSQNIPEKDFRYTSIQLNKNYNAKMHVDKNNHGPSYIIGLGDYQDGQLWIYDPNGNYPMVVPTKLMNYNEFNVGDSIPGRLVDIKNKWCKFNGKIPHAVLDFSGPRISIVYFCRKGGNEMGQEPRDTLTELGFPLPDEAYLERTADFDPDRKIVVKRRALPPEMGKPAEEDEPDSDDEVDENYYMAQQADDGPSLAAGGWADKFNSLLDLGKKWQKSKVKLGLCTMSCGPGPVAGLVLQELLPMSKLEVLCVADESEPAIKLTRTGDIRPMLAFKDIEFFEKGVGFCEVSHKDQQEIKDPKFEHLFVATFQATPFLNRDRSRKQNYSTDVRSKELRVARKHIVDRKPPLVLLQAIDWDSVDQKQQKGVLQFILDDADWGLRTLPGYNLELRECKLRNCGLPLDSTQLHIFLAKQACANTEQLQGAVKLATWLGSSLPGTNLQELLFPNEDAHVVEATKKMKKRLVSKDGKPKQQKEKVASGPYTELLKRECADFSASWFADAPFADQAKLNQIYLEACDRAGLDRSSLVVDLGQLVAKKCWRDDGILPGARSGTHYSFLRNRPLTGKEEMMVRGYPSRMSFKGVPEAELHALAAAAPALQPLAASLTALIAVAKQLPGDLALSPSKLEDLIAPLPQIAAGELTASNLSGAVDQTETEEVLTTRAVSLLNLLSHRNVNGAMVAENEDEASKMTKESEKVLQTLKKTAEKAKEMVPEWSEVPFESVTSAQAEPLSAAQKDANKDEPRDWQERRKKLRNWDCQQRIISCEWAMRWVTEAAADQYAQFADAIIFEGCNYLKNCFRPYLLTDPKKRYHLDTSLAGVSEQIDSMIEALKNVGGSIEEKAIELEPIALEAVFIRGIDSGDPKLMLGPDKPMDEYIDLVMRRLKTWESVQKFFEHFMGFMGNKEMRTDVKKNVLRDFKRDGGFQMMVSLIREANIVQPWREEKAVLAFIAKFGPHADKGLLVSVLEAIAEKVVREEDQWRCGAEVVAVMGSAIVTNFTSNKAQCKEYLEDFTTGMPNQFERVAKRFQLTKSHIDLDEHVAGLLKQSHHHSTMLSTEIGRVSNLMHSTKQARDAMQVFLLPDVKGVKDTLKQLDQAEDDILERLRQSLDGCFREAKAREQKQNAEMQEIQMRVEAQKVEQGKEKLKGNTRRAIQELRDLFDYTEGAMFDYTLREQSEKGHETLRETAKKLKNFEKECNMQGVDIPAEALDDVWKAAKKASDHWCKRKARTGAAKHALANRCKLGYIIPILERDNLLDRLDEMKDKADVLLDESHLPPDAVNKLVAAAKKGTFAKLEPEPPKHWKKVTSNSTGLEYLQSQKPGEQGKSLWEWPPYAAYDNKVEAIEEPKHPLYDGKRLYPDGVEIRHFEPLQAREKAEYLYEIDGQMHCLLCDGFPAIDPQHFGSRRHKQQVEIWNSCTNHVRNLQAGVEKLPSNAELDAQTVAVWRAELVRAINSVTASQVIKSHFWHQLVNPTFPKDTCSSDDFKAALQEMVELARRSEPKVHAEPPKPGKDFHCFPEPKGATSWLRRQESEIGIEDSLLMLSAEDLITEGISVAEDGAMHCGYCNVDLTFEGLKRHLVEYYREGKYHSKMREAGLASVADIKEHGWRLEGEKMLITDKQWKCECSNKPGEWYALFQAESGHAFSKAHMRYKAELNINKDEENERKKDWGPKFEEACTRYKETIRAQAAANQAWKKIVDGIKEQKKRAAPPATTTKVAVAKTEPKAAAPSQEPKWMDTSSMSTAPSQGEATHQRPELPVNEQDFNFLTPADNCVRKQNGRYVCCICTVSVPDANSTCTNKRHASWRDAVLEAVQGLREHGHMLWREGITIKNMEYECKPCSKKGPWYELFGAKNHWETKNHQRYAGYTMSGIPPQPWEDEYIASWKQLMSGPTASSAASATPSPKREAPSSSGVSPDKNESPTKRQRTNAVASNSSSPRPAGAYATAPSVPSSAAPAASSTAKKCTPSGQGYLTPGQKPDPSDLENAATTAKNRWLPPLPPGPLTWGYFDRKQKNMFILCKDCVEYVGMVKCNFQTGETPKSEEGGYCPHYTKEIREGYLAEMMKESKKWGGNTW